jgi:hypothetical protein
MPFNAHTLADAASAGAAALALALEEAGAGRKPEDVVNRCVWEWRFLGSFRVRAGKKRRARPRSAALAPFSRPLSAAMHVHCGLGRRPAKRKRARGRRKPRGDVARVSVFFYSKRSKGAQPLAPAQTPPFPLPTASTPPVSLPCT